MAVVTFGLAAEQLVAACRCGGIETAGGRLWRRDSQLIELKSLELGRYQIIIRADVLPVRKPQIAETICCRDRKLPSVVQTGIPKSSLPIHFQIRHEGIPVGNGSPTCPGVQVHSS